MRYFAKLYGLKDTAQLNVTHIHRFHQYLRERKKERKDPNGNQFFSETFIYKTMIRIKAYIKWLDESSYLKTLKPSEIPIQKIPRKVPEFLTKQEIKQILTYLNDLVLKVETTKCLKIEKYAAYMRRALVRMLYTT